MLGQRLAGGPASLEGDDGHLRGCRFCLGLVVGAVGLDVFELHLELFDQPGMAFGAVAELLAPEPCDLQSKIPDQILGGRNDGLNLGQLAFGSDQCALRDRRADLCRSRGGTQNSNL